MQASWLLVGLVFGALAGAWVMRRLERTRHAGVHAAEVARLEGRVESAESASRALVSAREELLALVRQGAGDELAHRGGEVVTLVKAHLETAMVQAGADEESRKRAVSDLVEPLTRTLTHLKERVDKADENWQKTERELTAQLRGVTSGQQDVARSAAALERALRQPHVRGRWGELGLRRLAEATGMSDVCDFVEQSHVEDDGRAMRPDMLVHLPGQRLVVVDAKVPLSPFLDAMEATEEADRLQRLKLFARAMREHVRKLSDKNYATQFPSAPDFVVMYVPGDHFLGGALEVDAELVESAFAKRVHIATPASLLSLLRSVAYAFQQQKIAEDAQAVAGLGRELYDRLGTLLTHIDKVSRCVNSLVNAQSEVVGSLERRVLPTARKFAELGVAGAGEQLPGLRPVTATARLVQAHELDVGGDPRQMPSSDAEEAA